MITVNVKLFGPLREFHPEKNTGDTSKSFECKLYEENTVQDLMDEIALPRDEVKIVFINNKKVTFDTVLNNNDEVGIFPPIAGG